MANAKLNPDQEVACNTIDSSCLVVAGPGSGKTKLLEAKAKAILAKYPSARILAVTFTRDAADELRARIVNTVGNEFADQIISGTFHSIAIEQLKAARLMPRIISEPEQHIFYEMAYEQVKAEMSFDELDEEDRICLQDAIYLIEGLKRRFDPKGASQVAIRLLQVYNSLIADKTVIDLQEILMRCVRGMRDGTVAPINVTHVFVDEFQDTDYVQYCWLYELYRLLAMAPYLKRPVFTVVGDDDQSIYAWRQAMGYQGMMRYIQDFTAQVVTLGMNYRSRTEIVRCADILIGNNAHRVQKRFDAFKGQGGTVQIQRFPNKQAEVKHVATLIAQATRITPGGHEYEIPKKEWAILARNKWLLNKMETALLSFGIPYTRAKGESFWERQEVVLFLGFIRTITGNYNNLDQVLTWARVPGGALASLRKQLGPKLSRIRSADINLSGFESHVAGKIGSFQTALRGIKNALSSQNEELALCLARDYMIDQAESNRARSNIELAAEALQRLKGTLGRRVAYLAQATKERDGPGEGGVELLTLHSSKGLEYTNVVILGCEEKVIPSEQAVSFDPSQQHGKDAIAEERRLFFVGITRAMERVVLTYSIDKNERSRFLAETGITY